MMYQTPLFKFKVFVLSLLAISSTLAATQGPCYELTQEVIQCCFSEPLIEVKTGYFSFSNSKMRKIYDKGGLDIQLCASYPLQPLTNRWTVNAYAAIEYLQRSGQSINGDQKTSLWSVPVNIGLKPVYAISPFMQYYLSAGPRYFYIQQHNSSPYVYKSKSKNGLGFFVNTGFNYLLNNNFVIDIFGEYSYAKTRFHGGASGVYTRNIQVGGFTFGGGLGHKF